MFLGNLSNPKWKYQTATYLLASSHDGREWFLFLDVALDLRSLSVFSLLFAQPSSGLSAFCADWDKETASAVANCWWWWTRCSSRMLDNNRRLRLGANSRSIPSDAKNVCKARTGWKRSDSVTLSDNNAVVVDETNPIAANTAAVCFLIPNVNHRFVAANHAVADVVAVVVVDAAAVAVPPLVFGFLEEGSGVDGNETSLGSEATTLGPISFPVCFNQVLFLLKAKGCSWLVVWESSSTSSVISWLLSR